MLKKISLTERFHLSIQTVDHVSGCDVLSCSVTYKTGVMSDEGLKVFTDVPLSKCDALVDEVERLVELGDVPDDMLPLGEWMSDELFSWWTRIHRADSDEQWRLLEQEDKH